MHPTLIVMPTYNERDNLPRMAQQLLQLPTKVDLLVVDDNSPDGTGKLADELAAQHPEIHVLHRTGKNGLGRAYLAGFTWALERDYEFIFEMDGDFSHNPNDVPQLLEAAQADLRLVKRGNGVHNMMYSVDLLDSVTQRCRKAMALISGKGAGRKP